MIEHCCLRSLASLAASHASLWLREVELLARYVCMCRRCVVHGAFFRADFMSRGADNEDDSTLLGRLAPVRTPSVEAWNGARAGEVSRRD